MKEQWSGDLLYYQSPLLNTIHGFSTKLGGVSQGVFASMNLIAPRGDSLQAVEENYRRFHQAVGLSQEQSWRFARNAQVHGKGVRRISREDTVELSSLVAGEGFPPGDALVTNETEVALWVYSADCVPILLHDPVKSVIAAVHSGWRGTAEGVVFATVETMVEHYACSPKDITVAIGPSIGACCFSCHKDVVDAMEQTGLPLSSSVQPEGEGKYAVDLKKINGLWLQKAGVEQVDLDSPCTACDREQFWSHRLLGEPRGSMGAMIALGGTL